MIDDRFKSFQKRSNEDVTWGVNDEMSFILYMFMVIFGRGHGVAIAVLFLIYNRRLLTVPYKIRAFD